MQERLVWSSCWNFLAKSNTSGIKNVSKLPPELSLKQQCSCHYYAQDAEDGSDYRHMLGWMQISIELILGSQRSLLGSLKSLTAFTQLSLCSQFFLETGLQFIIMYCQFRESLTLRGFSFSSLPQLLFTSVSEVDKSHTSGS